MILSQGHIVINGSSPRVRGTLLIFKPQLVYFRFIPACAGNTCINAVMPFPASVHPRVCGEHHSCKASLRGYDGSSPRVRGTLFNDCMCMIQSRFIPACAGNTKTEYSFLKEQTVHPRVCGEHDCR